MYYYESNVLLKWTNLIKKTTYFSLSSAHILGEAMERVYGGHLCYGPPIEQVIVFAFMILNWLVLQVGSITMKIELFSSEIPAAKNTDDVIWLSASFFYSFLLIALFVQGFYYDMFSDSYRVSDADFKGINASNNQQNYETLDLMFCKV